MLRLRQSNEAIYNFAIQRRSAGFSGSASIKFSINAPLRARALADIKEKYLNVDSDAIAPTDLILFNNTDLEPSDLSATGTVSILYYYLLYMKPVMMKPCVTCSHHSCMDIPLNAYHNTGMISPDYRSDSSNIFE